ncbi:hypothetical protein ACFYM0_33265 [Streptomyces sp. NPDC006487]|uniref:hypothetical protein n=1 Tax=Streptomyces sp. NPDC006487 TaxID=3364748 RepID=UPI0036AB9E5D
MGNNQSGSGTSMRERVTRLDERQRAGFITAEQAEREFAKIMEDEQNNRLFHDPDGGRDLTTRFGEVRDLFSDVLSLETSYNAKIRSQEAQYEARMQDVDPARVTSDLGGWAERTEKVPGNVATVFDALKAHRTTLDLPKGYRGGCYASTYALVETLNGRPTRPSFGKETPVKEFGPESRTKRLGDPLLKDVSLKEVLLLVRHAPMGSVYELRGGDDDSGHVIVAIAPKSFLDPENGVTGTQAIEVLKQLGKTKYSIWYSGKLAEDLDL